MDLLDKIIADSEQVHDDIQTLIRDLKQSLDDYAKLMEKL